MYQILELAKSYPNEIMAFTALGTLFTSAISVVIATFAISSQRRHDRAAVRPMAHVFVADYEDDIYVGLENVGLGPMVIDEVKFVDLTGNSTNELVESMPELLHNQI